MVRLRQIGRDQYELEVGNWVFLFSYGIPVAAFDRKGNLKFETEEYFSVTTSRHIMRWMERLPGSAGTMKQRKIESLLERED